MNSRFICIIGTDGVGKTTHVNKIIETLKKKGISCSYRWFRFFHFFSFFLLAYCRLRGFTRYEIINGHRVGRHYFYKSKFVSVLYPYILFIDVYIMYFFKVYIPMYFSSKLIVCDRFIHDTIVDLMIDLNDFNINKKNIGKLFMKLIPKNSKVILLRLDLPTIHKRRKDLLNDHTLDMRDNAYLHLANFFDIPIVENNGSITEVHQELLSILELN